MKRLSRIARSVKAFTEELARPHLPAAGTALPTTRPKIGLAFGGGFARGMAHIGVLKVFEEENIPIDFIAGTSVGAVVGAGYCSGLSAKELEEIACLVRFKDFARWTISRFGVCSNDRMTGFLHKLLKARTFEELRIPLAVSTTDFVTGEPVVFRSGALVDAVRASCAYPGMFLPVNINGRLLVDGLLAYPVPATPLREMGADRVVAVHLSAHWVTGRGPRHVFDVIGQCFSIAQEKMCSVWQKDTDVILDPQVGQFAYDAFERSPEMIKLGAEVTRKALPQIKSWLAAAELQAAQAASVPVNLSAARIEAKPVPSGAPMSHPAALLAK
jgi:NTE family protein